MTDDDRRRAMLWNAPPPPPRVPRPGEVLFEFIGGYDKRPMSCELRFHGESFGWEGQFLSRGELFHSRGAFPLRAQAVAWAEEIRKELEAMTP